MAEINPVITNLVKNFGKFKCKANPACINPTTAQDNSICVPGINGKNFGKEIVT